MPEKPRDAWYGVHNGYEVQIDATGDDWHCTGALYSLSKVTARNIEASGRVEHDGGGAEGRRGRG
jgi:hypothetical protein